MCPAMKKRNKPLDNRYYLSLEMNFKKQHFLLSAVLGVLTMAACASCGSDNDEPAPVTPGNPSAGGDEKVEPASTDIIYEANPRFFAKTGALREIENQLPRISGMGCDVLWLMPIFEPGEVKSVGSPYCIKDYKKINPAYGTDADLKSLIGKAHSLGMKVILDWVANHTSFDNTWTTSHPERYKKDANGNIAATKDWADVAQLDYSVASTEEGMIDAMEYWVKNFGIDGYRCDYAEGVPHDFWKKAITALRKIDPKLIMLAETSQKDFYEDGFDMIYDWSFAPDLAKAMGKGKIASFVNDARTTITSLPEGKSILRYAFNHDVVAENEFDRYFGSADGVKAAYALAAMLGGTPMIYSGMDADNVKGKLSFFNYSPLTFSSTLTADYSAIDAAYKETADVRGGTFADFSNGDVAGFTYKANGNTLLVVVNTANSAKSYRTPIQLSGEMMEDLLSGSEDTLPVSLDLEPYGYKFYLKR